MQISLPRSDSSEKQIEALENAVNVAGNEAVVSTYTTLTTLRQAFDWVEFDTLLGVFSEDPDTVVLDKIYSFMNEAANEKK